MALGHSCNDCIPVGNISSLMLVLRSIWALQMLFPSCSLVLYDRLAETQNECKCAPYAAVFHGAFFGLFATITLSGLLAVRQEPSSGQRRNS